jgi:hypothetical protein
LRRPISAKLEDFWVPSLQFPPLAIGGIMKKTLALFLSLQLFVMQNIAFAENTAQACTEAQKVASDSMRAKLAAAQEELKTSQDEIAKEKAQGHLTLSKSSALVAKVSAAGAVVAAIAARLAYKMGTSGQMIVAGLAGAVAAVLAASSGLLAYMTSDSAKEVRIETLEKRVAQLQSQTEVFQSLIVCE